MEVGAGNANLLLTVDEQLNRGQLDVMGANHGFRDILCWLGFLLTAVTDAVDGDVTG